MSNYNFMLRRKKANKACKKGHFKMFLVIAALSLMGALTQSIRVMAASGFYHNHNLSCYQTVFGSCSMNHPTSQRTDGIVKHCVGCQAMTQHTNYVDWAYCTETGATWQREGVTTCDTCGTVKARWSEGNPSHTITRTVLGCGKEEGQMLAEVQLSAPTEWSNDSVPMTANINTLSQDLIFENDCYSWDSGMTWSDQSTYTAEENGSYSVLVKNVGGTTAQATIQLSNIDKIPPVITDVSGNEATMTSDSIAIHVAAMDGAQGHPESGLAETAFSFDGGTTWQIEPEYLLTEAGALLVVRDVAGNMVSQALLRSGFPYPPQPVAPPNPEIPEPEAPSVTQAPVVSKEPPKPVVSPETIEVPTDDIPPTTSKSPAKTPTLPMKRPDRNEVTLEDNTPKVNASDSNGDNQVQMKIDPLLNASEDVTLEVVEEKKTFWEEGFLGTVPGRVVVTTGISAGTIGIFVAFFFLLSCGTLFCYDGKKSFRRMGLLHFSKEEGHYQVTISSHMIELSDTGRYRLEPSRWLTIHGKDAEILVKTCKRCFTLTMEDSIDFTL